MTDSNNSGNNPPDPALVVPVSPNTAVPKGQPGQVLGFNGNWITIPVVANGGGGGGTCSSGGSLNLQPGTGTGQISFDDLAVPVESKEKSDGCFCKKCKEYYQYAEPNQKDKTLICYSCRTSW